MRQHPFGRTGRSLNPIGQGTWYIDTGHRTQAVDALRAGLDAGMVHIDTAEMYGNGAAEAVVGEAIRGRRDEAFLVSKVLPGNASRKGVRAACERSLQQLGTDYLDCYLLHWRGQYPLEDTFATMQALKAEGKILSYGVSNFDVDDLDEALAIVGPGELACNQVLYHLNERAIEHAVIPWCKQNDVAVVAYSPFGHDDFPLESSVGGALLADIAAAHGATPRQVALAFLTRDASVFAIPKAAQAEHARDNAAASTLMLHADELAKLDATFERGARPAYLPMI